jgi:hypothetical protein
MTVSHGKVIRDEVQALKPLLSLLDEPEPKEGGPIEQLQTLLETILTSQHQLHLSLEDLHAKVDALSGRRRSSN